MRKKLKGCTTKKSLEHKEAVIEEFVEQNKMAWGTNNKMAECFYLSVIL